MSRRFLVLIRVPCASFFGFLFFTSSLVVATSLMMIALGGCGPLPAHLDPTSAEPDGELGRPAMSLRWKKVLEDTGEDPNPQEFASAAVALGPSQDRDIVFIGSHQGTLFALEASSGRALWEAPVGSIGSQPVLARGRVYVGNDDGTLICLDTDTGKELWRFQSKGSILAPPVLTEDLLLFSNEDDQVYALDRRSGKLRWKYKTNTPDDGTLRGHAGVAIDNEFVYAGFSDGNLVALRQSTGSVAWLVSLAAGEDKFLDVDATPVIAGDMVFTASSAGGLYAIDRVVGRVRWRLPITGVGAVAVDSSRLYAAAADEGVHALDFNGNLIWRQGTAGGGEPVALVVSGNYILYSLSIAGIFVANKASGETVQFFNPGNGVSSIPAIARDALFILSNGAVLYAMSLRHYLM